MPVCRPNLENRFINMLNVYQKKKKRRKTNKKKPKQSILCTNHMQRTAWTKKQTKKQKTKKQTKTNILYAYRLHSYLELFTCSRAARKSVKLLSVQMGPNASWHDSATVAGTFSTMVGAACGKTMSNYIRWPISSNCVLNCVCKSDQIPPDRATVASAHSPHWRCMLVVKNYVCA